MDAERLKDSAPSPSRLRVGLTLLAIFAAYLLLASSSSLWDRDEPRFARCTVEMVKSGDYLVPTFNEGLRPDKPAGIYWLMSVGYKLFGLTEVAFRLPSILGITGAAFLTYLVGRRLFNERVGYRAMIFYATAAMVAYMATASTADGAMNGLITLSLWCFVELIHGRRKLPLLILMAAALSMGQLVKGPVALAVPLLSMITMGVIGARTGAFKLPRAVWLGIGAAALVSIAAFLAWAIPANNATGGALMDDGLKKHVVERATSAMEDHGGSSVLTYILWLPFYLPVILVAFMPWTMHLLVGASVTFNGDIGGRRQQAVIIGWVLPTFVLMTVVATKLPHYILPIFPGLALMCAAAIDPINRDRLSDADRKLLRLGRFLSVPILVGVGGGALTAAVFSFIREDFTALRVPGLVMGALLIGLAVSQSLYLRKGRSRQATHAAALALPLLLLIVCFGLLPAVESMIKPSRPLADAAKAAGLPDDAAVALCGFNEASLVFYLDRPIGNPVDFVPKPADVAAWAQQPGPGLLVITQQRLDKVRELDPAFKLETLFESDTINYSSGTRDPKRLLALKRGAW